MQAKISVVLNTLNNEDIIERAIRSVKWADEVIVCDMNSEDKTVEVAKRLGAKIFIHEKSEYVELVRNFIISKATNHWVLILDPDEEVPQRLAQKLGEIANDSGQIDFVRLPRKNIIFHNWMKAAMWWPDYNIRFFKKGMVHWDNKIHRPPQTEGKGIDLEANEDFALIHHHYKTIPQFLERMIRYTKIQAKELKEEGYKFDWKDLIKKPLGEFLSRFFVSRGFEDGLHGLALSLLQSFSFLIVYLRLWEMEKFKPEVINTKELRQISRLSGNEIDYWFKYNNLSKNPVKRFIQKVQNRI